MIPFDMMLFGLIGGSVRIMIGYSKIYGMLGYNVPFRWKKALFTIIVSLVAGTIAPVLINSNNLSIAFIAGFAGTDLLEALAKGLMKAKTGFATGFTKSRYSEFGASDESGFTKNQQKALQYIDKNDRITNNDYQRINRVSRTTAYRDLNKLRRIGTLKKFGSGRKTYYKLA